MNQHLHTQLTFIVEKTSICQHKPALVPLFHTTACLHHRKKKLKKIKALKLHHVFEESGLSMDYRVMALGCESVFVCVCVDDGEV